MRTALVLALVSLAAARPADACSCLHQPIEDQFKSAPVVLVARVVRSVKVQDPYDLAFELEVEAVWKGQVKRRMMIRTTRGGGDCGRGRLEKRWIFFTRLHGGSLRTSICDASRLATKDALAEMVKKFGKPKAPPR